MGSHFWSGNKARIGDLQPGWMHTLHDQKWLPIETLTSVDHQSPFYNMRNKTGIFYAQSWALMHMVYFDDRYRPHMLPFISSLATGKSFQEACQTAFKIPMAQVEKDLKSYFSTRQIYAALVDVKLTKSEEEAVLTPLTEFDSRLA